MLVSLLEKYSARSTSELYDKCAFHEWQEICQIYDYHRLIDVALELYIKYHLDIQRKGMFKYATSKALMEPIDPVQQNEFAKIFHLNGINPTSFSKCFVEVLNKTNYKVNYIRLIGVSDSCKTLIANCMSAPFISCRKNNHGSEGEFFYANLLNQAWSKIEELWVTQATAEDLKSILAGEPIDINKKKRNMQLLSRTPGVITSNYAQFGRGHLPAVDEEALSLRCHTFIFTAKYKPICHLNSNQFYLFILSHVY